VTESNKPTEETPEEIAVEVATESLNPLFWYVVHTYSGYENRAKIALEERKKLHKMEDKIGQVLIPTENVVEVVQGKKKTSSRKFYPGYMFVQMVNPVENKDVWHLVKNTPKVTGFVGDQLNPLPVPEEQIAKVTNLMTEGAKKTIVKVLFSEGEQVRVIGGSFSGFTGIVEEVKPEKSKLRVLVSIFGRATPVELDFIQVEKA
jgi:transcription termination/antitermination protein NusG